MPDAGHLPLHVLKLILDGLKPLALLACQTTSICSSTSLTRARTLPSVRTLERILSTTISSKRRALSLGVSQASLPRFMIDWQT